MATLSHLSSATHPQPGRAEIQPQAVIVEDDRSVAGIFELAVQAAGYQTKVFHDGRDAWAYLKLATPALVLLDLHLPGLSGASILSQIRLEKRLARTRVLLASGDGTQTRFLADQADLVFNKPISFSQLRDLAARLRPEALP